MHCFQFTVSTGTYIHTTVQYRWLYYHIIIYKNKTYHDIDEIYSQQDSEMVKQKHHKQTKILYDQ